MNKASRILPFVFFVISGACALVYEVAWGRHLSLFLGNTTLAHMCVLISFMGGLALGSVYLGRWTERLSRPLCFYGWLEILIGCYAILFPFFVNPLQMFALRSAAEVPFGSPVWVVLKLAVSLLVLLAPTVLMGGTFPVLMRHFKPASSESEDKTEWLYLANCAGAVAGTLLAAFILIPGLGLKGSLVYTGIFNGMLGALAVGVGRMSSPLPVTKRHSEAADDEDQRRRILKPVYTAIAISGAAAMIYELVWIRMFAITLGGSTYSFALMLAAFISGIALGSLAVGLMPWARRSPVLWFAIAEMAIGFAVIASIPFYERLPYIFWKWSYLLRPSEQSFWLHSTFKYSLCFLVMLVPTFFSGMALPLAVKAAARKDDRIGRDAGLVYGANTAGTIAGSLLAGLVFIPLLGLRSSLELALMASVGAGFLLLRLSSSPGWRRSAVFLCVLAVALMRLAPEWHPASFTFGSFRNPEKPPKSWRDFRVRMNDARVHFYGEDGNNTVAVLSSRKDPPNQPKLSLYTDGKAEASSDGDMPTQILIAHLPMLLKPDAESVMLVGLGSGVTAGSVLSHPYVDLDCVEISPVIVRAARHFSELNNNVLDDPRMNLIIEDARTVLAVTPKKYDVVISEPTNPWVAGMGNLFSLQFFHMVDRVLNQDGLIVQWFHTYEMSDDLVKMTIRTMRRVFPYVYIFHGATADAIMVGSRKPIKPDFNAIQQRLDIASVRDDLDRISVDSTAAVLGLQMLSAESSAKIAGSGPVNTDDTPLLEYRAPRAQYVGGIASVLTKADERLRTKGNLFSVEYLKQHPMDRDTCRSLVRLYSDKHIMQFGLYYSLIQHYVSQWPDDPGALNEYAKLATLRDTSAAVKSAERAVQLKATPTALETLSDILVLQRFRAHNVFTPQDFSMPVQLLKKAAKNDPPNSRRHRKLDTVQSIDSWSTTPYPGLQRLWSYNPGE